MRWVKSSLEYLLSRSRFIEAFKKGFRIFMFHELEAYRQGRIPEPAMPGS